jgi:hypothetical protein
MLSKDTEQMLLDELKQLDNKDIEIDGKVYKPSQCYRWEANPTHLLYNTNCPSELKEKLEAIISKYTKEDEGS